MRADETFILIRPTMTALYTTLLSIVALVLGAGLGYFFYGQVWKKKNVELQSKLDKADDTASGIVKKAEERYRIAEQLAKETVDNAHAEAEKRLQKVEQFEARIMQKEERLDQKIDNLEKEKEKLAQKDQDLDVIIQEQK